jgi:hypothetical protein
VEKIESCRDCANFEDVYGIPVCTRIHTPGIACDGSRSRLKESSTIQQENEVKTALLEYIIANEDPKPVPALVINLARKMEW